MSYLSDWSSTIARISEDNEKKQLDLLARYREEMPAAIASLPEYAAGDLVELFIQFTGGRADPRETALRQEFHDAIRAEIIRRMISK